VKVNTQVKLEDLLMGMIIQSGNDASVALAEHVAGSEEGFVTLMNGYAKELGMHSSHFTNSTGLPDPDLYVTARDVAILSRANIREFPDYYKYYSIKEYSYNGITQYNRNRLLWRDQNVDGMKTGHTESAGYCLVASAIRDDMRLITVVLGTASESIRAKESLEMLNYGFRTFETHRLYDTKTPLSTVRVWKGATKTLTLGVSDDLYITVPRGQYKNLKATMEIDTLITAPSKMGQRHGMVKVKLGDREILTHPLVALQNIERGSWWRRIVDTVLLWFQ
jgi:D-alanyl-D-alanine carboxypeptidase (penicillin-binding protein 5/6)